MKNATFKIEGMHCSGCAETIKMLMGKEPGVQMCTVSFEDGEARVLYDPKKVEEDHLVQLAEKPGYRVVGRQ